MPKPKKGTKSKGKQKQQKAKPKRAEATPPAPTAAETAPATEGAEAQPVETPDAPESKAKKGKKPRATEKEPSSELDALRAKASEAKEALTVATNEASALRMQAMGVEAAAKRAYAEALAPYRATCRKSGQPCEFPGIKAPSTFPRARFLIERAKDGLKVAIAGRPETEEKISAADLQASVWRAARDYCTRHFGEETTEGRARGLGLRFRAVMSRS